MKLFCMMAGGVAFSVDVVDPSACISDLAKLIKLENPHTLASVDTMALRLFLAKRGDTWLSSTSDEVKALETGDTTKVEDILKEDLDPTESVDDIFKDLGKKTIHVLVTVPPPIKPIHRAPPKKTVCCAIVGKKGVVTVDVFNHDDISHLKKCVKAKAKDQLKGVTSNQINFFFAKRGDVWISDTSPDMNAIEKGDTDAFEDLLTNELNPTRTIGHVFEDAPPEGYIHAIAYTLKVPKSDIHHPKRLKRWRKLNELFVKNKKTKANEISDDEGPKATAYSRMTLPQVELIFEDIRDYIQDQEVLPDDSVVGATNIFVLQQKRSVRLLERKRSVFTLFARCS